MITLKYDIAGTNIQPQKFTAADRAGVEQKLADARDEVLADAKLWSAGGSVPAEKQPLDAGFHYLPNRLLDELAKDGPNSELGRIRATAERLASSVDRVVVLGIGGSYMGARACLEALCHPYYNEVPRDVRGGRPKLAFEGNNVDNDAVKALIELLKANKERWAIAVISKSGGTLETAAAFRILLRELSASIGTSGKLADYVVPVTGNSGKLFDLAQAIGCGELFPVPDGVGGRFSVLSAVGLLPAAIMGIDIEQMLAGAVAMNEHFATAAPDKNIVLQYVATCHLFESKYGCDIRLLSTWGKRLEALGLWYDQLLAESLGKHEQGALPLTIVNTRDLHSRGQQHQEGKRDKLITNLIVSEDRAAPLMIGGSDRNQDGLNELASKSLPSIMSAAIAGTNQAYADDQRPTADIVIPKLNAFALGELFQLFMLATVVEGRLLGINPYGQPGVEAYKKNMNAILRK